MVRGLRVGAAEHRVHDAGDVELKGQGVDGDGNGALLVELGFQNGLVLSRGEAGPTLERGDDLGLVKVTAVLLAAIWDLRQDREAKERERESASGDRSEGACWSRGTHLDLAVGYDDDLGGLLLRLVLHVARRGVSLRKRRGSESIDRWMHGEEGFLSRTS